MRRTVLTVALLVVAACSRDHSLLAADPDGAGGAGGALATVGAGLVIAAASAGSGGDGGGGPVTSSASGGAGAGGAPPIEPDGPTRLVLVHGILDRPRVAVCLTTDRGDAVAAAPSPSGGVAFASSATVEPAAVPGGEGDVVVVLVAGEASALEDVSCAGLLAAPGDSPSIEVLPIGALPRSAVDAPRVLALIAAGCLGGEGEDSEVGEAACGAGFDAMTPTATLVATPLSRIVVPERVGLQAVGGSLASAPFDVTVRVAPDGVPFDLAEMVSLGAALPNPPDVERDAVGLTAGGTPEAAALLPNDGAELATVDLAAAMERSGIDTLEDGRSYAMVFVGPTPTLGPGPFWPAFDAAMIAVGP